LQKMIQPKKDDGKRERLENRLKNLEEMRLEGEIGKERYQELKAPIVKELDQLEPEPETEVVPPDQVAERLDNLVPTIKDASPTLRNRALRQLFERIVINASTKKVVRFEPHAWCAGLFPQT